MLCPMLFYWNLYSWANIGTHVYVWGVYLYNYIMPSEQCEFVLANGIWMGFAWNCLFAFDFAFDFKLIQKIESFDFF
jgi:hypothetical protein